MFESWDGFLTPLASSQPCLSWQAGTRAGAIAMMMMMMLVVIRLHVLDACLAQARTTDSVSCCCQRTWDGSRALAREWPEIVRFCMGWACIRPTCRVACMPGTAKKKHTP